MGLLCFKFGIIHQHNWPYYLNKTKKKFQGIGDGFDVKLSEEVKGNSWSPLFYEC